MQQDNADNNSSNSETSFAKPEDVVSTRKGEVLLKHTILKSDHFPVFISVRQSN